MALSIQDSRILLKRSTNTSEVPTAAPSSDFTDGTWTSLDVYVGEAFANTVDEKLWLRFTNNIRQIAVADSPTTNRLTYWNASGHLGNVSAPTDGYYLKYTNASGYHWATAGGAETQTLSDVLALGNTSGAYDILMNTTQRIGFKDGDNTYTTYISNNQSQAANRTVYTPLFDGRLVIHATGTSLTSGRVPYVTTNGLIADSANFLWDNTNYRLGVGNGVSSSATIHAKGSTADSTSYAAKFDNSSSSALLYVKNDGLVTVGDTTTIYANLFSVKKNVAGLAISDFINTNTSDGGDAVVTIGQSASKASLFIYHNSASTLSPYLSSLTMADTLKISASKTGTLDTGNIATVARNIYNITSFIGVNGANTMLDQTGFKISNINSGLNSANSNLFTVNGGFSAFGFTSAATAYVDIVGSTTTAASLRIRTGTAPTSPNDGDIWQDGTDIKIRIGGVTKVFTLV